MDLAQTPEASVIGACLMDPAGFMAVADYLVPDDFYSEGNREIYAAMYGLWRAGEPINDTTVTEALRQSKKLTLAGGAAYISSLTDYLPDVANVDYWAERVKEAALSRQLHRLGDILKQSDENPQKASADAMSMLINITAGAMRSVPEQIGEHTTKVYNRALQLYKGELKNKSLYTGMPRFDALTGGLKGSDFIVIGARPSVGKSAFALHLLKCLAERGHRGLFISLEMSNEQVATRLLASESGVPYSRIQDGYLSKAQPALLEEANVRCRNLPIVIDDKSGQSIGDIQTKARRERARGGLDIVVVDYLQLAAQDSTSYEQVTLVSNGMKALSKDLDIPVVALSQLSRGIEQRDSKRPVLSDLRQTGAIEQDADVVMFLHYPDRRKMNELELELSKHRNGGLGRVLFNFEKQTQRFTEIGGSEERGE